MIALIVLVALSLLGGMLLVAVAMVGLVMSEEGDGLSGFGPKVGVITISGVITASGEENIFGETILSARAYMKMIRSAGEDDSVKAVVVRINSPGGGAAASQEIYTEIMRLREKKPVVISMAEVAASGGYYIASAGSKIYANPATLTGSIGVIMETVQYQEMLGKLGIEAGALTTGPYKDTGSPVRPMREDERQMLKAMLNNVYEQFVRDVAKARKMDEAAVRKVADGRVLTGEQALKAGLVDELGNYHDAIAAAAKMGGIEGEPKLKHFGSSRPWAQLLGTMTRMREQELLRRLLYDFRLVNAERMLQMPALGVE